MDNRLSLICIHIINATRKIEARVLKHKPVNVNDSGNTIMCYLCHDRFGDIVKANDTSKFQTLHEEHIKNKILNYE